MNDFWLPKSKMFAKQEIVCCPEITYEKSCQDLLAELLAFWAISKCVIIITGFPLFGTDKIHGFSTISPGLFSEFPGIFH